MGRQKLTNTSMLPISRGGSRKVHKAHTTCIKTWRELLDSFKDRQIAVWNTWENRDKLNGKYWDMREAHDRRRHAGKWLPKPSFLNDEVGFIQRVKKNKNNTVQYV